MASLCKWPTCSCFAKQAKIHFTDIPAGLDFNNRAGVVAKEKNLPWQSGKRRLRRRPTKPSIAVHVWYSHDHHWKNRPWVGLQTLQTPCIRYQFRVVLIKNHNSRQRIALAKKKGKKKKPNVRHFFPFCSVSDGRFFFQIFSWQAVLGSYLVHIKPKMLLFAHGYLACAFFVSSKR